MNINYPMTRRKIAECKEKSKFEKTRNETIDKTTKNLKANKVNKFSGMLRAKNEKGQLIYITEALRGGKYICPVCGHNVIAKLGNIRAHHFAHKANNNCDKWYEMTDWHRNWQELFPEKFREIILKDESLCIHRADIKVGNLIIEFQHSYLGLFEWDKRINFYNKYGLLVFVLDVRNKNISQINSFSIEDIENCKYIFNWHKEHNSIPIIKSKFNNKLAIYEKTYFRKQNELNKQSLNLENYYKVMKEEIENAKINLKKSYEIDRKKAEIEFKKSINTAPFQLKKSKEIFESKKSYLLTIINRLNIGIEKNKILSINYA